MAFKRRLSVGSASSLSLTNPPNLLAPLRSRYTTHHVPLASVSTHLWSSSRDGPLTDATKSVRNLYLGCGHAENLVSLLRLFNDIGSELSFVSPRSRYALILPRPPAQLTRWVFLKVKCSSTHCKFSPNHPSGCVPPSCSRSCNQ